MQHLLLLSPHPRFWGRGVFPHVDFKIRFCSRLTPRQSRIEGSIAQSLLETGYYTSRVCLEKNNLFGLRRPKDGSNYEFDNWEESVKAYRHYVQYKYKGGDYYQFLQRIGYAEDPDYVAKVRQIARTL